MNSFKPICLRETNDKPPTANSNVWAGTRRALEGQFARRRVHKIVAAKTNEERGKMAPFSLNCESRFTWRARTSNETQDERDLTS